MSSLSFNQFLMLYMWFPLAVLLVFFLLIARFYQKFSNAQTYYRLFLVPMVLFGATSVRYAGIDRITGDAFAEIGLALAGIMLTILCVHLYWVMVVRKSKP